MLGYLIGVFGLGCCFARKSSHTEEFMAAGRSLPGWVVGLSIFGTYVSSISFLANPGSSYTGNWSAFVFSLSILPAVLIADRFFVPFYRKSGEISAYTHLEQRFGPWARLYAVVCFLLTQIGRTGTILYLVSLPLGSLLNWDIRLIIIITGLLVTVYTLLGGIEAVIWTDVVQSLVLSAGLLISLVLLFLKMPGGMEQFWRKAVEHEKFSLGSYGSSLAEPTFWVILLYGFVINLQNFGIDQSYVQRYITAKSEQAARRSLRVGAGLYIPVSAMLFLSGTALFVFYSGREASLPQNAAGVVKGDAVFPHFIVTELPDGLTGLLIAAIVAAAMSSVDSSLNSSATLILQDLYKRYWRPEAGEWESMRVLYCTTIVFGVAGTGTALAMIQVHSALKTWWTLAGLFGGGMLGLFLLGLFSRARNAGALPAVALGVLLLVWMWISKTDYWPEQWAAWSNPLNDLLPIVAATLTILCTGLGLSLLFQLLSSRRTTGRINRKK